MVFIIVMLILSGLVKTYKNIYAPDMAYAVVLWATWVHNIGFVLFILAFAAHIGAIVLKPNRPMLRGIFTGAVRLDYAEHREEIEAAKPGAGAERPATLPEGTAALEGAPVVAEAAAEVPRESGAAGGESGVAAPEKPGEAEPGSGKPPGESPSQG